MLDRSWMRRIALAAVAGGVTLALVVAPFTPGGEFPDFAPNAALAKGGGDNGADHSGGKGGGKGGKGGKGASTFVASDGDSHGKGHTGHGNGHGKDAVSGVDVGVEGFHPANHGELTSMLGSLNAAHAIANGNTNDNLNSKVGQIGAYMEAFNDYAEGGSTTVGEVADALLTASNKDLEAMNTDTVEGVVGGVNDLLGDVDGENGLLGENVVDDEISEREVAEEIAPPSPPNPEQ
jgi:hypothetical protein